jgi:hypothetical protein
MLRKISEDLCIFIDRSSFMIVLVFLIAVLDWLHTSFWRDDDESILSE